MPAAVDLLPVIAILCSLYAATNEACQVISISDYNFLAVRWTMQLVHLLARAVIVWTEWL